MARVRTNEDLAAAAWRPLARFFFETARHRSRIIGEHGLTPNDAKALHLLSEDEGTTMSALADSWMCDASNATWIVDRLEEHGLAERRPRPGERRVKLVVLKPRGAPVIRLLLDALIEPTPVIQLSVRRVLTSARLVLTN